MREMSIRVAKYAQFVCLAGILVLITSCSDYMLNRKINAFFKQMNVNERVSYYDLRDVIPVEWEEVCIVYFPYITRSDIEKKFHGKVVGPDKFVSKAHWMLLGINGKREITQVVLDVEVGTFFLDNFRGPSWK